MSDNIPLSSFPTEQANTQEARKKAGIFLRQENNTLSNIKMMLSMITPALTFEPHELAQFQSLQDNDVHRSNYEHGVFAHIQSWPACSADSTTRHDLSCSQVGAFVPTFVANHQQCFMCVKCLVVTPTNQPCVHDSMI